MSDADHSGSIVRKRGPIVPRFVLDDRHAGDVTKKYMEQIGQAIRQAGFFAADARDGASRRDVIVTDEVLVTIRYLLSGYRRHIVWIQGLVPEESYLRRRSLPRRFVLSQIEKYVLKHAELLLLVSPEMLSHYERKYKLSLEKKSFIMPCFCEEGPFSPSFTAEKEKGSFAYIGSLSVWQCFPQTAAFYAEIERRAVCPTKLVVFTEDTANARKILAESGAVHYEVRCLRDRALLEALAPVRYGFALRADHPVNRAATPTKLSVYAACGLTPIYSPVLADFSRHAAPIGYGIPISIPTGKEEVAAVLCDMADERTASAGAGSRLFSDYYNACAYRKRLSDLLREKYGYGGCLPKKRRVLITVGNLRTGGIANALYALIGKIHSFYDITLLCADGMVCRERLPADVSLYPPDEMLRSTETPRRSLGTLALPAKIFRIAGAAFSKIFGKRLPFLFLCRRTRKRLPVFDAAVSFSQPSCMRSFCNISCELALYGCHAQKRIAFVHCDFGKYGANSAGNRRLYRSFDQICAVSKGTADAFLACLPQLRGRTCVVPNIVEGERILSLSVSRGVCYPNARRPVMLSVARLSPEKGHLRCIPLMRRLCDEGFVFEWHIVGSGPCGTALAAAIRQYGLSDVIFLHGEEENPYRYMAQADFLFHPSFHEAAPLVFSEAALLALPVLATDTCSAGELLETGGVLCGTRDEDLYRALASFLAERTYESLRCSLHPEEVLSRLSRQADASVSLFRAAVEEIS